MAASLWNIQKVAEVLCLSPSMARALLQKRGVQAIDFGSGRGKGLRWYSTAIESLMLQMHHEAQESLQSIAQKGRVQEKREKSLVGMPAKELMKLYGGTNQQCGSMKS